jgi:hypothetical protein
MGRSELNLFGLGSALVAGSCEHDNEPSVSIKGEEFLDWMSDYCVLKKYSVLWSNSVRLSINSNSNGDGISQQVRTLQPMIILPFKP